MADEQTEEVKETKETTKLSAKVEKIAKEIEGLTALELSELAKHLEEVFGVSAMPAMAAMPMAGAPAAGGEAAEEKTSFSVMLTDAGANKLAVIKAVREVKPELGLMDAKKLVEEAPKEILAGAKKEDADAAVAKITEAGGKAELK
jgi:large subunit ribosomal protein L7/L12